MRAKVSAKYPEALAICDRCGFRYNHVDLQWQMQWAGPKIRNTYRLVCQSCLDVVQEQLRTVILPPDPTPIQNARPENSVSNNNPLSAIGANASPTLWRYSGQIGNLTGGGGVPSAFDSNSNKPRWMSANNSISNSSFNNYVGVNWGGDVSGITTPSSLAARVIRHSIRSFTATAPNDAPFLGSGATTYAVQGSQNGVSWVTLYSTTTAGTNGETVSGDITGNAYQFARFAILGDRTTPAAVAQVEFYVGDTGSFGASS
jgi:hypothetical protein